MKARDLGRYLGALAAASLGIGILCVAMHRPPTQFDSLQAMIVAALFTIVSAIRERAS